MPVASLKQATVETFGMEESSSNPLEQKMLIIKPVLTQYRATTSMVEARPLPNHYT